MSALDDVIVRVTLHREDDGILLDERDVPPEGGRVSLYPKGDASLDLSGRASNPPVGFCEARGWDADGNHLVTWPTRPQALCLQDSFDIAFPARESLENT